MSDYSSGDVKYISISNLLMKIISEIQSTKELTSSILRKWGSEYSISLDDHITLVMSLAGDSLANDFLVEKLTKLNEELHWKFPHKDMIRRCAMDALFAVSKAASKHAQSLQRQINSFITSSLAGVPLTDKEMRYQQRKLISDKGEEFYD